MTAVEPTRERVEAPHPESYCHRCGGPNVNWYAPSPLWNVVMGYPDQAHNGIVCPTCFAVLAREAGIADGFRLDAPHPKVELPNTHVDGRVWNAATDLWDEPRVRSAPSGEP